MPYSHHPAPHNATLRVPRQIPQTSLVMGGVGAIIGGAAAAARNIRRMKEEHITRQEAVRDTLKEAAGVGLASTVATAVVGAVGASGVWAVFGAAAAAAGTKYLWDAASTPARTVAATAPSKESKPRKSQKAQQA